MPPDSNTASPRRGVTAKNAPAFRDKLQNWAKWIDSGNILKPGLEPTLGWLVRLRWVVVLGQAITLATVHWMMRFAMPIGWVFSLVGFTAASNLVLQFWAGRGSSIRPGHFLQILLLDILILTGLLALTGGAHNPFASFYLVHVAMAAVALGSAAAWGMAMMVSVCYGLLFVVAGPHAGHMFNESQHLVGMAISTSLTAGCIAYFAGRLSGELHKREQALGELRILREQGERFAAMATLAAGIAHEISTPLGTIAIAATELQHSATEKEMLEDAFLIRKEVDRCRSILDRLNAQSTNSLGESVKVISGEALWSEISVAIPKDHAANIQHFIEKDASFRVPKLAFAQAVASLLKNAVEAGSPGQKVRLRIVRGEDVGRISVRDEGHGMPQELLGRIGEPFLTTKPPGKGMGLGLFLIRRLMNRIGGRFTVSSEAGWGTTITLEVPVQ